ncbi:MAG: LPS assembly lipoprotein LptE [Nitrospirae bacterium YQR-1]
MVNKLVLKQLFGVITFSLLCLCLSGCGYRVLGGSSLPFTTVKVGKIQNTTSEPKLEDIFYVALAEELLKRGVSVTDFSENTIEGNINYFQLVIVSEKKKYASEYKIDLKGDFVIKGRDGKNREFKGVTSPFYESFYGPDTVNAIVASKETAAAEAVKRLAASLVFEILISQ